MSTEQVMIVNRRTTLSLIGAGGVLATLAAFRGLPSISLQPRPEPTKVPEPTPLAVLPTPVPIEPTRDPADTVFIDTPKPVSNLTNSLGNPDLREQNNIATTPEILKTSVAIHAADFDQDNKGNSIAYVLAESGRVFRSEKGRAFQKAGKAPVDITREVIIRGQAIFVTGRRLTPPSEMSKIQASSSPVACVSYDGGKNFQEMDLSLPPQFDAKIIPFADTDRLLVHAERNSVSGSERRTKSPFSLAVIEGATITPIGPYTDIFSSVSAVAVNKLDPNTAILIGIGSSEAGLIYVQLDLRTKEIVKTEKLVESGIDRLYPVIDKDGFPQEAFAFTPNGKLIRVGLTLNESREQIDLQTLLDKRLEEVFGGKTSGFFKKGSMTILGAKGERLWFSALRDNPGAGPQPFLASIPTDSKYFPSVKSNDITIVPLAATKMTRPDQIQRRAYSYQGLETGIDRTKIGKEEGVIGIFESYLAFAGVNKDGTFNGKVSYPIKGI